MNMTTWTMYCDGAARGNPGPSGVGGIILRNGEVCDEYAFYIGERTNNQAEYCALLVGLQRLMTYRKDKESVNVFSDSELLVKQLSGAYRIKNAELACLAARARSYLIELDASVCHVLRDKNKHADKLANQGVDSRTPLPTRLAALCDC